MKKSIILFILITGFIFSGCATTPQDSSLIDINELSKKEIEAYNSNPNNTNKIVCKKEKPVGSNLPTRVCRMKASIDERSLSDQQELRRIQSQVTSEQPSH